MSNNPASLNSLKQSPKQFLEIYGKMVEDSHSLAIKLADSIDREKRKECTALEPDAAMRDRQKNPPEAK